MAMREEVAVRNGQDPQSNSTEWNPFSWPSIGVHCNENDMDALKYGKRQAADTMSMVHSRIQKEQPEDFGGCCTLPAGPETLDDA